MNLRTQKKFIDSYANKDALEVKNNLNQIVEKIAKLSQELNIDDALSSCNLYSYLLFNGILSVDGKFTIERYGNHYKVENIILGLGDSCSVSKMLEMLLTKREFENYSPVALLRPNKIDTNCELNIQKIKVSYPTLQNVYYYHPVNLVIDRHNNNQFVYDTSLGLLMYVKNSKRLQLINGYGSMELSYQTSNIFDKSRTSEFFSMVSMLKKPSKKEFIETFNNDLELFDKNSALIDDFKDDIKENITGICKRIRK